MLEERNHLGIEFELKPIHLRDRRPQVVDDQSSDHAAKMAQRILRSPNEVLRGLPPEDFRVTHARMAQDHAPDMRPVPLPILHHPSALAKIDLRFLTRPGCDAPNRQGTGLLQLPQMRAGYIPLCVKAFCVLVSYRFRRTMASLFTTPLVCPAKAAR